MSQFQVFTYQFREYRRKIGEQLSIFDSETEVNPAESMKQKQELFEQEWKDEANWRFMIDNKEYVHKLLEHKDHIIVFRIANNKKIRREDNFKIVELDDKPSCMVIIDNRKNRQQLFVQINSAFSKQTRVAEILQESFRERMRKYGLVVDINARYEVSEFWNIISRNPSGVKYLKFTFTPKNLPWLSGKVKRIFDKVGNNFNGQAGMEIKAQDNVPLTIRKEDPMLEDFLDCSSASGMPVEMRMMDMKSKIICGKETKILANLDNRTISSIDNAKLYSQGDISDTTWGGVITSLNEVKLLHD